MHTKLLISYVAWTVVAVMGSYLLGSSISPAADIRLVENMAGTNIDTVTIQGEIQQGDYATFVGLLKPNHQALVILSSPGGMIQDALSIGTEIRFRNYSTDVLKNGECYSACALIWLAGVHRLMATTSKIGFHAAYTLNDGVASEKGEANAEVGSYLTRLGFSIDAIRYFTSAPPNNLQFLDFQTAEALNIDVTDSGSLPTVPSTSVESTGTSFDCAKAGTQDELAVCRDEGLSKKDRELARLYGERVRSANSFQLKAIKSDQRTWLEARRACFGDIGCLNHAYDFRLQALSDQVDPTDRNMSDAFRPSFSCDKVVQEDEKAVCSDSDLARKDYTVANLFMTSHNRAGPAEAKRMLDDQRRWLAIRYSCGSNIGCLTRVYDERLRELQR